VLLLNQQAILHLLKIRLLVLRIRRSQVVLAKVLEVMLPSLALAVALQLPDQQLLRGLARRVERRKRRRLANSRVGAVLVLLTSRSRLPHLQQRRNPRTRNQRRAQRERQAVQRHPMESQFLSKTMLVLAKDPGQAHQLQGLSTRASHPGSQLPLQSKGRIRKKRRRRMQFRVSKLMPKSRLNLLVKNNRLPKTMPDKLKILLKNLGKLLRKQMRRRRNRSWVPRQEQRTKQARVSKASLQKQGSPRQVDQSNLTCLPLLGLRLAVRSQDKKRRLKGMIQTNVPPQPGIKLSVFKPG